MIRPFSITVHIKVMTHDEATIPHQFRRRPQIGEDRMVIVVRIDIDKIKRAFRQFAENLVRSPTMDMNLVSTLETLLYFVVQQLKAVVRVFRCPIGCRVPQVSYESLMLAFWNMARKGILIVLNERPGIN